MKLSMEQSRRARGFTLVELVVSMAVFSFLLLIVMGGFLHIVRISQNGVASRQTQQNARFGLEQMVKEIRSASAMQIVASGLHGNNPTPDRICLTDLSVRYYVDTIGSTKRLYRDTLNGVSTCNGSLHGPNDAAVTSDDVRVVDLEAIDVSTPPVPPNPPSLRIKLLISSQDSSQLDPITGRTCDPTQSGGQFCSTTTLTSSITLRGTP